MSTTAITRAGAVRSSLAVLDQLSEPQRDALADAFAALLSGLESEHSRRAYNDDWERWCRWLADHDLNVLTVGPRHVYVYIQHLAAEGKAKATRARALTIIRQVYGAFVVSELRPTNPAREVRNVKVSADPKTPWLEEEQLAALLRRPPAGHWKVHRDWLVCAVLGGTGLRRAEVARLRWEDLQTVPGGFQVRVSAKGGKEATVAFPTWLSDELRAWKRTLDVEAGAIFPRDLGGDPVSPSTVWNAVKRTAERAGVDPTVVTPHALRRSFATITGHRGVSIEDRQAAMIHASKTTTERYDKAARLPEHAPGEVLEDLVGDFTIAHIFPTHPAARPEHPHYVEELQRMIDDGNVTVTVSPLPDSEIDPNIVDEIFTEGRAPHRTLCARAATWLTHEEYGWSVDDLEYVGGRADVRAAIDCVFVECGFTSASKVIDALTEGLEVVVCPYHTERAFHFKRSQP